MCLLHWLTFPKGAKRKLIYFSKNKHIIVQYSRNINKFSRQVLFSLFNDFGETATVAKLSNSLNVQKLFPDHPDLIGDNTVANIHGSLPYPPISSYSWLRDLSDLSSGGLRHPLSQVHLTFYFASPSNMLTTYLLSVWRNNGRQDAVWQKPAHHAQNVTRPTKSSNLYPLWYYIHHCSRGHSTAGCSDDSPASSMERKGQCVLV